MSKDIDKYGHIKVLIRHSNCSKTETNLYFSNRYSKKMFKEKLKKYNDRVNSKNYIISIVLIRDKHSSNQYTLYYGLFHPSKPSKYVPFDNDLFKVFYDNGKFIFFDMNEHID
jgi:hypothetical protein